MSQKPAIQAIEDLYRKSEVPQFQVGDTVDVHVRIREGEKERVQVFTGTVIRIRGGRGLRGTFTVRRIVSGEGVERVFPFHCPHVVDVQVRRPGKIRRAKLYYLRERIGKATKVKERRVEAPKTQRSKTSKKTKRRGKGRKAGARAAGGETAAPPAEPTESPAR